MGRVVAVTMAALNCLSHVVIVTCMVKDSPKRFNVDRIGSGASERKDCDYIELLPCVAFHNFFSRFFSPSGCRTKTQSRRYLAWEVGWLAIGALLHHSKTWSKVPPDGNIFIRLMKDLLVRTLD